MSSLFSSGTNDSAVMPRDEALGEVEHLESRPPHSRVDSNSVRWVFAATVAFWLAVYAAGRTFF